MWSTGRQLRCAPLSPITTGVSNLMKPRFSKCTGPTPTFLRDLESGPEKYSLVFAIGGEDKELHFLDEPDFFGSLGVCFKLESPCGWRTNGLRCVRKDWVLEFRR